MILLLFAVAMAAGVVVVVAQTSTPVPQSAKAVRGASPYVIAPSPNTGAMRKFSTRYWIQTTPMASPSGSGASTMSLGAGSFLISTNCDVQMPYSRRRFDDLPWWWADASDNNTIDIAGLPVGQHKVRIELVDANHRIIPGQTKTVTFTLPVALRHE